jgi:hypothetical protein
VANLFARESAVFQSPFSLPIIHLSAFCRTFRTLPADVAGYSQPIGADEEGTLARLKAHRSELIDPKIAEHRGRIVKTTGDGLLVEFASVVDALRCAADMLAAMAERNAAASADGRIEPWHRRCGPGPADRLVQSLSASG